MSKKFFIIIAIALGILLASLVAYYFLIQSNATHSGFGSPSVFKNFFPFGSGPTSTTTTSSARPILDERPTQPQNNFNVKLRKISSEPVAGVGIFDSKINNTQVTTLRHIEKSTGHIFETELFSTKQSRISNTTVPSVYDANWGTASDTLVAQYLKEDNQSINTYLLSVKIATSTPYAGTNTSNIGSDVVGTLLPSGIQTVSMWGTSLFYLNVDQNGSTGYILTPQNKKGYSNGQQIRRQIWQSPVTELLPQFVNGSLVALTTKPYPNIGGYLYFINTSNGGVRKILGNIAGLSTLISPDGNSVLTLSQNSSLTMANYAVTRHTALPMTPSTFPEKCVWSKKNNTIVYCAVPEETLDGSSLTRWYMGTAQYTDDIWKYDLTTGTSNIIESLTTDAGESVDVIKPILGESEQYLVFINKRNGSLWSLDLSK